MSLTEAVCPYCSSALAPPERVTWYRCDRCDRLANIDAQRAFSRARDYLSEAEEYVFTPINPKHPPIARSAEESAALEAYQRAHSSLELAFQSDLPQDVRLEGIAMMADVTQRLAQRGMLTPLEANFWVKTLVERNGLQEQAEIDARLAAGGSWLRRIRWWLRQRGLRRGLRRVRAQIAELEDIIQFIDPPHVYPPRARE